MKTKHSITFFSAVRTVISGAARGLSQGAKLNWRVPAGHYREPTSQNSEKSYEMIVNLLMSWMSILAKKTKTPRKMQKKTTTQRILNIKMSTGGGPVFTFSFPGGGSPPCQLRHWLSWCMTVLHLRTNCKSPVYCYAAVTCYCLIRIRFSSQASNKKEHLFRTTLVVLK